MAPVNTVPHILKLGKLHSPSNLKLRADYFEQKYGEFMRAQKISDKADKDYAIKSSEFYQRYPSKGFRGFDFQISYLNFFYMIQEMIEELEMLEHFTSDEESISDEEEIQPVSLPLCFDFERGLTYKGKTLQIMNEDGGDDDSSDEGEPVEHRPVSRLSLEVDERYDNTMSDGDSDYYFCESEVEDDDFKKVIYGSVPGVAVGDVWKTRRQCSRSLVHVPGKSRIHAGSSAGCSIVLSSKEMVDDEGVLFTYKNKAKIDKSTNIMAHQLIGGNKALQNNFWKRAPIRVIRSYQLGNRFAPKKGYRYDGLYDVENITYGGIKNGYQYCKATLVRCPNQPPPPWAKSYPPAGYVPGHLLSTTEIDYTTGDEYESSYDRETPVPPHSAVENCLGSRSKSKPIVLVEKLSAMEIEKAMKGVYSPKEPVRKSYLQQQIHHEETKNSGKESNNGKLKKLVSAKCSKSSQKSKDILMKQRNAAAKLNRTTIEKKNISVFLSRETGSPKRKRTLSLSPEQHNRKMIKSKSENKGSIIKSNKKVQGFVSISNFKNEKIFNKPRADISKNHDLQNEGARKSAKQKPLDEKKATPGAKNMTLKLSSREGRLPKIKQRNKLESIVSHNRNQNVSHYKKQTSAQAKRGNAMRKRGRKEL